MVNAARPIKHGGGVKESLGVSLWAVRLLLMPV